MDNGLQADTQVTCRHLDPRKQTALLEGGVFSLFSSVADIELMSAPVDQSSAYNPVGYMAIVSFSGYQQGFLAFACSDRLARQLASNMLDESDHLSNRCLCSTLGEAAVILLTSLLQTMPGKACHAIAAPSVFCNDTSLLQKLRTDNRGCYCSLAHGAEWVLARLVIHPENCLMTAADRGISRRTVITPAQAHRLFTCPRFGHHCRQELHPETAPFQTMPMNLEKAVSRGDTETRRVLSCTYGIPLFHCKVDRLFQVTT
jgi:CheY-specific phosphatase CheX